MDNDFFINDETEPVLEQEENQNAEEMTEDEPKKPKKNKYEKASIAFKILAVLILLISVACGVAFSFTEATTLVPYGMPDMPSIKTETIFEVWRTALFAIVGVSNGLCLWAVSEVFKALGKKKFK
ncbi:MAG: hypothetical protein KBS52_00555 [Clostridiales bacterium]|nr:hypothetical protein [Candidatus Equinaster intestinalis]